MQAGGSTLTAQEFVEEVVRTRPRIAVFDCDGTLWQGDSGMGFFYWELARNYVSPEVERAIRARYDGYLAGKVDELSICGEMIQINQGVPEQRLREAAREFFAAEVRERIFPEMQELTRRLASDGCELWAVSSTNNWVVEAGAAEFGIRPERCLAATLEVRDGIVTSKLLKVPTDELKQTAIEEFIGRRVDAVFGNSMHDFAMLEQAARPYAINPNPDLAEKAAELGWTTYFPLQNRK
ncbi:MAG: haloacid dehalogenase-like hydrolase [Acidobacteriota bacterium]|nr:haloacid dehalogenase-like hydrolase [Acidobacteriota bacterium]